jgi:hypothetical protein
MLYIILLIQHSGIQDALLLLLLPRGYNIYIGLKNSEIADFDKFLFWVGSSPI